MELTIAPDVYEVARGRPFSIVVVSDEDDVIRVDVNASAVGSVVLIELSEVFANVILLTCRPQRKPVLLVVS